MLSEQANMNTDEVSDITDVVPEWEKTIADLKDQLLRTMADMDNTRKRASKEKEDAIKFAVTNFARDLLAVADNFDRALDACENKTIPEDLKSVWDGIQMTRDQLLSVFDRFGVKAIDSKDKPFDSTYHQAVFEVTDPTKTPGTVAEVVQKGYVLQDRLLRPAMVGVVKG